MVQSSRLKEKRESNFELLRIVAMLMIVAHHFSVHSNFNYPIDEISLNRLWIQFIQMGGKIGVDVFVLITGYFQIKDKKFRIGKLVRLWLQVLFYSVVIYYLCVSFGLIDYQAEEFKIALTPISSFTWWFADAYFILYILTPFLNFIIKRLNKIVHLIIIISTFFILPYIPTFSISYFGSDRILWFIYLYFIGSYISLYKNENKDGRMWTALSICAIIINFLIVVILDLIGLQDPYYAENATYFYGMNQIPILLISIFLVNSFKNSKLQYNKIINVIASASFGVYLIHDNYHMRQVLWDIIFKNASYANSADLVLYSLLVIMAVYNICTFIEILRLYIIEKPFILLGNKIKSLFKKENKDNYDDSPVAIYEIL